MKIIKLPSSSNSPIQWLFTTNVHFNSSISTMMTSQDTSVVEFIIASTRLRPLILKKHISTLYTQLTQERNADPHLTRKILLNMFQIFQINKIHFEQNCINILIHSFKNATLPLRPIILLSDQNPSSKIYLIECVPH